MFAKKRVKAAFLLALAALLLFSQPVFANTAPAESSQVQGEYVPIEPLWTNIIEIALDLSFSGNTAYCGVTVIAVPAATHITATIQLARRNANGTYTTIRTWNDSTSGAILAFCDFHRPVTTVGNTYRLSVTVAAMANGVIGVASDSVTNMN